MTSIRAGSVALLLTSTALAGPLQQAEINKIVNDVRVVDARQSSTRPAAVRDVIKGELAVRTGVDSRAELLFQDNTLTRLGAGALFSFQPGTREMTLDRGTMLLQVPKGLGGARIRAAAVTAAITGTTIMLENIPGDHVKVLVLEGQMKLSLNSRFGQSVVLNPGRMAIIGVTDRQMPKPVAVDLGKVVKTSVLIDPAKFSGTKKKTSEPLPSMGLIQKEIATQSAAKANGQLAETRVSIEGGSARIAVEATDASEPLAKAKGTAAPAKRKSGAVEVKITNSDQLLSLINTTKLGSAGTQEGEGFKLSEAGERVRTGSGARGDVLKTQTLRKDGALVVSTDRAVGGATTGGGAVAKLYAGSSSGSLVLSGTTSTSNSTAWLISLLTQGSKSSNTTVSALSTSLLTSLNQTTTGGSSGSGSSGSSWSGSSGSGSSGKGSSGTLSQLLKKLPKK